MSCVFLVVRDSRYFLSHRLSLAQALAEKGFKVQVLCALRTEGDLIEIEGHGFRMTEIPLLGNRQYFQRLLKSLLIVMRMARTYRPEAIFSVTVLATLLSGISCRIFSIRHIALIAGLGTLYRTEGIRYSFLRLIANFFYRLALQKPKTKVVFQNENDRDTFLRHRLCRVADSVLIPGSGVKLSTFPFRPYALAAHQRKIVLVSRMLKDKGVIEFVEAARLLRQRREDVDFILVGGIDPTNPTSLSEAELKSYVDQGAVKWLNHQPDIAGVLNEMDIFCLPSYHEGLPKAMLEAAAIGCPLIVSDIPGCRAFVEGEFNGILVPAKNASALAEAIDELLNNPRRAAQLSSRAYDKLRQGYTEDKVMSRYLELFVCRSSF